MSGPGTILPPLSFRARAWVGRASRGNCVGRVCGPVTWGMVSQPRAPPLSASLPHPDGGRVSHSLIGPPPLSPTQGLFPLSLSWTPFPSSSSGCSPPPHPRSVRPLPSSEGGGEGGREGGGLSLCGVVHLAAPALHAPPLPGSGLGVGRGVEGTSDPNCSFTWMGPRGLRVRDPRVLPGPG